MERTRGAGEGMGGPVGRGRRGALATGLATRLGHQAWPPLAQCCDLKIELPHPAAPRPRRGGPRPTLAHARVVWGPRPAAGRAAGQAAAAALPRTCCAAVWTADSADLASTSHRDRMNT